MKRRLIAIFLAMALCCGWVPVQAANEDEPLSRGAMDELQLIQGGISVGLRAYQSRSENFTPGNFTGADNQRMVQAARAQLGRAGSSLGYSEQWCADFTMDLARIAQISSDVIPWNYSAGAAVQYLRQRMINTCGAQVVGPRDAKPGDIITFDWDNNGWSDHVAVVIWYDKETDELVYIGGNQGEEDSLYQRHATEEFRAADDPYIHQILRPNYQTTDYSEPIHKVRCAVNMGGVGAVDNQDSYILGETVTLTAVPANGYVFDGWYEGSKRILTTPTYTFQVTGNVFLNVRFAKLCTVTADSSRSGVVTGGGIYPEGTTATLTVQPKTDAEFEGWYTEDGVLLSCCLTYEFTVRDDCGRYAMFAGDTFYDVKDDSWFKDDVLDAVSRGIVKGYSPVRFGGELGYTRAMMVEMLSRLEDAAAWAAKPCQFEDVDQRAWYAAAVNWAAANDVVKGMDETHFEPERIITREQFLVMVVRYLEQKGYYIAPEALPYTDAGQISFQEAQELIPKAQAIGLIRGDGDGNFRPQDGLLRHEGVTIFMRMMRYLDANPDPKATHPKNDTNLDEKTDEADTTPETPADPADPEPDPGDTEPENPAPTEQPQEPKPGPVPEQPEEAAG